MNRPAATLLALLTAAAALAGCSSTPTGPHSHIHFGFAGAAADIDADVAMPAGATNETAYRQLQDWRQASGHDTSVTSFSFGHCLGQVDKMPDPDGCGSDAKAYWNLAVDGANATVGMDDVVLRAGDRVDWTLTPIQPSPVPNGLTVMPPPPPPVASRPQPPAGSGPNLTFMPVPATRNATVTLHGHVGAASRVALTLVHGNASTPLPTVEASGDFTVDVPVAAGDSQLRATADTGKATAQANVTLVRLASATVSVRYHMVPGHADTDDTVWLDVDAFASASMYQGKSLPHPPHATVHDLIVAWANATGHQVTYEWYNSLGYAVSQIDGVGSPVSTGLASAWCYDHNGSSANNGITTEPIAEGDTVQWNLGCT